MTDRTSNLVAEAMAAAHQYIFKMEWRDDEAHKRAIEICGALTKAIHALPGETECFGWQPTDTAPRDTVVLTLRSAPAGQLIALAKLARVGNMGGWISVDDASVGYFKVTHWMPIPAFPVKTTTSRDLEDGVDELDPLA